MGHCSASFLLSSSIFFPQYVPGHMRCVVLVSPYSDVQTNKKIKIQHKIQRWPNLCASVLVSSSIHSTFSFIRFSFIRVLVFFLFIFWKWNELNALKGAKSRKYSIWINYKYSSAREYYIYKAFFHSCVMTEMKGRMCSWRDIWVEFPLLSVKELSGMQSQRKLTYAIEATLWNVHSAFARW